MTTVRTRAAVWMDAVIKTLITIGVPALIVLSWTTHSLSIRMEQQLTDHLLLHPDDRLRQDIREVKDEIHQLELRLRHIEILLAGRDNE